MPYPGATLPTVQNPLAVRSAVEPKSPAQGRFLHDWQQWLIPALLCAILLGQLYFSSRRVSQTADEATHLYSGYRYLKCGDLTVSPEHPPLAKMIAAVPLLSMNVPVDCAPFHEDYFAQSLQAMQWFYSHNWPSILQRSRMAVCLFAASLCLLVWILARRMFGLPTAIIATAMVAFEPNILAQGAQIMTDVPGTVMILLALFGFYLVAKRRTPAHILLTGVATGLALLTKHTGLVLLPTFVLLAILDPYLSRPSSGDRLAPNREIFRNLLSIAAISAVAFAVLWAGYGFRYASHPGAPPANDFATAQPAGNSTRVLMTLERYHVLPQAYIRGLPFLISVTSDPEPGPTFFMGKLYPKSYWFVAPMNLLLRCTLPMLAMCLMAAFGAIFSFRHYRREILYLLVPAGLFLAACMHASLGGGVRYMLPLFPLLIILAAAGCNELSKRWPWMRYALPCLLALHAASSLSAYPNYLSYVNEAWGGPAKAYRYTGVDTGQAYLQVREYLAQHPSQNCWLLTDWQWDPEAYGMPCRAFGFPWRNATVPERLNGTVILSSGMLSSTAEFNMAVVRPFREIQPKATIAGSAMLVYEGEFDTRAAASASATGLCFNALSAGRKEDALKHLNYAVLVWPENRIAHGWRGNLLADSGNTFAALAEFEFARRLTLSDPLRQRDLPAIDKKIAALRASLQGE